MNYRVTFFKLKKEQDGKTKNFTVTGEEILGAVTVDDAGTGSSLTLAAKAFRTAAEVCMTADKIRITLV